jgi:hypothetical protein
MSLKPNFIIWKYVIPIPVGSDVIQIDIPRGAEILALQLQYGEPTFWALVNPGNPVEHRRFRITGTGHEIEGEKGHYWGTFQLYEGRIVLHVFEVEQAQEIT